MFEKIYKGLLGTALLSFAIYLVTRMRIFAGIGAAVLLLDAVMRCIYDFSHHQLPWQKNSAASAGFCGEILDRSK